MANKSKTKKTRSNHGCKNGKTQKQIRKQSSKKKTISRCRKTHKRTQRAGTLMQSISQLIHGSTSSQQHQKKHNQPVSLCAPVIKRGGSTSNGRIVSKKTGGRQSKKNRVDTVSRHSTPTKIVVKESVHPESCLTEPVVLKLARAWNTYARKHHNSNIKPIHSPNKMDPAMLWEKLRNCLGHNSGNGGNSGEGSEGGEPEDHWFDNPIVREALSEDEIEEIKDEHYRPEAPDEWHKRPDAWLSTTDIEDLLEQYEDKYPEFRSYGASPIDFDLKGSDVGRKKGQPGADRCMVNSLCNINLRELTKERKTPIKYIGVVFNLDPHDKGGSHWISMFVNLPSQEINFWDSYGYKPPQEVRTLMAKLLKQGRSLGLTRMKCQVNQHRHQYKNSECGMYSSWFIIQQLEGKSFQQVCQNIIKDDEMNQKRRQFYNY